MRLEIVSPPSQHSLPFLGYQRELEVIDDRRRHLVLDREHILEFAVVAFGPEVTAVSDVDELNANPQRVPGFSDAPLDNSIDAERVPDLPDVGVLPLEEERGCARGNPQLSDSGQRGDELFGDAVAEVLLVPRGTHVGEGEDGDRAGSRRFDGEPRAGPVRLEVVREASQVGQQGDGALVARLAVLLERFVDDAPQTRRKGGMKAHAGLGGLVQDLVEECGRRFTLERTDAGRHFVEHHAQREQVAPCIHILPERLLGRHVGNRPERGSGAGQAEISVVGRPRLRPGHRQRPRIGLERFGQPEVQDLGVATLGDEDVRRLDIPMDDLVSVSGGKAVGDLGSIPEDLVGAEPFRLEAMRQRFAFQQFHRNEVPTFVLVDVVDGADVWVIQRRRRAGLPLEPGDRFTVVGKPLGQEFQRDRAPEPEVVGPVDNTHPPASQFLPNLVVRDGRAGHRASLRGHSRPVGWVCGIGIGADGPGAAGKGVRRTDRAVSRAAR